jgi:mRNA interferase RelE/StbE
VNLIYEVKFSKESVKYIKKLDKPTASRIINAIESMRENPKEHPQSKELKGYSGQFYRLRIGNLRVIYEIVENRILINVVKVGSRGDIYKHK